MSVILHLSDLHLNEDATWENLETVRRSVLDDLTENPKLIVVSGDFANHPERGFVSTLKDLFSEKPARGLTEIKATLEKFRADCGPECVLVVVPGNHDYREFGIVSFKRNCKAFNEVFPDWWAPTTLRMDGRLVVVFKFDSNTNNPTINAARGHVGKPELLRFHNDYRNLKEANKDDFDSALKIAVLHHHPLPIADSEDAGYFKTDGFLGLDDSGVFLREMAKRHIDIVLHGHKHHAFNSRIEINIDTIRRGMAVIAAGSASRDQEPEKSYNVIRVGGRSISGEVRRRKTGVSFGTVDSFPVVSYERYLARAFEDAIGDKRIGYYSDLIQIMYSVRASGDCEILTRYGGLRATGNGDPDIIVNRKCPQGTFSDHLWKMTTPHSSQAIFEKGPHYALGILEGNVKFRPALRPRIDLVNVEQTLRLYNAFAMDQEQRGRIDEIVATEHVSAAIVRPTAELILSVHFETGELPVEIRGFAKDAKSDKFDPEETERCQSNLRISPLNRTVTLSLLKPLKGCCYYIEWGLPPAPPRRYRAVDRGYCRLIKNSLLALNVTDLSQNPLTAVFAHEVSRLAAEYKTPSSEIEMGLMVFDPSIKRLRFVAGVLGKDTWGYRLFEGQGIAGRAHKIDRTLFFVQDRVNPYSDFIAQAPPGGRMPEIMICIPIRYPISTPTGVGETVAVMTLATYFSASNMLTLADDDNIGKAITIESQILFCEKMLPKLGIEIQG